MPNLCGTCRLSWDFPCRVELRNNCDALRFAARDIPFTVNLNEERSNDIGLEEDMIDLRDPASDTLPGACSGPEPFVRAADHREVSSERL